MKQGIELLLDGEGLSTNNVEIISPLDMFVQEVTILFDTIPTEVIFNNGFGSNFWDFLHNLNVSNTQIVQQITYNIATYCYGSTQFKWNIDIEIVKGTVNDIIVVYLNIYDNKTADFIKSEKFLLNT